MLVKLENWIKNESPEKAAFVFWLPFFLALIAFDQLAKYLAFRGDFFYFLEILRPAAGWENFKNFAFAFSWPLPVWLIYCIYTAVVGAIVIYLSAAFLSLGPRRQAAWVLILAGACSNIGERVFTGFVRDFIYIFSGIFNLADGYIIIGTILLLLKFSYEDEGKTPEN